MSESTTIYVVTSGEYSEYGINALFSTRELAEAYCAAYNTDAGRFEQSRIEEWPLDEFSDRWREGLAPYFVEMLRDGTVQWLKPAGAVEAFSEVRECPDRGEGKRWPAKVTALVAVVWAKSQEHAVKIVNDRRAQLLANGEWPEE